MEPIMSEFIKLGIDLDRCLGIEKCGKCIQICPVNIFTSNGDYPKVVELQDCEIDAITIHKLYEE